LNLGLNLGAGNHSLWAVAYDKAGAVSNVAERQFNLTVLNIAPTALEFGLEKTVYNNTETLRITHGSVLDANGATDINRIDFKIKRADGTFVDTPDIFSVTASTSDNRWGKFNYSLNLAGLNLASGNYSLWAQAYDKAGAVSNVIEQKFNLVVPNIAPNSLQFGLEKTAYNNTETLRITNGWVFDGNGATDINRVDFKIKRADSTFLDTADIFSVTPNTLDNRWGQFNYSLNLAGLNLGTGNHSLWAVAYDKAGAVSNVVERQFAIAKSLNLNFSTFNLSDASGDDTTRTAFQSGALNLSYYLSNAESLSNIRLEALKNGNVISTLGSWTSINLSNSLVNLSDFSTLTGGEYQFRIVARTTTGQDFFSASQTLQILSWSQAVNTTYGTVTADRLNYSATLGTGSIFVGRGGTDTLNLGVNRSSVKSINGLSLTTFNPSSSAQSQAIFRGTAFDYLTLTDGREIYFQGIENLNFSDGSNLELQVRTNDTFYGQQWNLRVSDVDTAWRFTQGSSNVLLVSLDTGIFTAPGKQGGITDISTNRLIAGTNADDNYGDYGHGHSSVSVMSSTANNGSGIAGINWNSSVYVNDVYNGVSLQQGIRDAIAYARSRNMRVVFQGGIQGDYWLNSGGTQAELEKLIRDNSDIATFAIAAGNGGPSGNLNDPNYLTSVSGVAKLQTTHSNVISVGALVSNSTTTVNGLTNTSSVDIASYSNRGSNLTLMAATDSLAMNKFGQMQYFGGTSCANPNMAGIASLVWSVNTNLNGGQLRQILIDTAMDLGASGKDNNFGNGLVNADAAVRRALALSRNTQLANLYSGRSAFA
jgi:hypothetical protein